MKYIGTVGRMWADTMYAPFADSLVDLMSLSQSTLCAPGEAIKYTQATMSWHSGARNQLVEGMDGKWLLQLDTDHQFAPDLLIRLKHLQDKYDLPVVSAIYQYKFAPHGPVAGMWSGDKRLAPLVGWNKDDEIIQVGAVGAGALLVRREVFKRIEKELKEPPFENIEGLSEDYSFCYRCRKLGIPVALALNIESHHIIRTPLHISDYNMDSQGGEATRVVGGILETANIK